MDALSEFEADSWALALREHMFDPSKQAAMLHFFSNMQREIKKTLTEMTHFAEEIRAGQERIRAGKDTGESVVPASVEGSKESSRVFDADPTATR